MLDKRLVVTGAAVLVVAALATVAALLPGRQEALHIQEPVSDVAISQAQEPEQSTQPQEYLYLIREYEGRVAVFAADSEQPEMIFEKRVRQLPEWDQAELKTGIKIYSSQELHARIEDYIS